MAGYRKHAKWITIVGIVLMLAAMTIYLLSLDESIRPGQPPQQKVPAAP